MTERKKITLSRPTGADSQAPSGQPEFAGRKPPVRGSGTAPRKRMTAAEAEQSRVEAAARGPGQWQDRGPGPDRPRGDDSHRNAPDARDARRPGRSPQRAHERAPERAPNRPQDRDTVRWGEPRCDRDPRDAYPPARQDQRRLGTTSSHRDSAPYPSSHTRARAQAAPHQEAAEPDGRLRLSKLMSERGLASRREADEWIDAGWVSVDGEVAELGTRVLPTVHIDIDPQAREQQTQRVTILLHKPIGYVSGQAEDGYEPAVVLVQPQNRWADDKLPIQFNRAHHRHLAPAGRLDIDSTGMLVLTQDGRVAKALIGEDSGVEKEYLVRVQLIGQPEAENVMAVTPPEAIEALRFGLELDGKPLKHAQVSWQNEQQLRVVLREGRKRQIRRMCELVGLKVVGLKRVRMGSVVLGKLPVGQWRYLRPDERF
jgi:23S rRNA pseudouridine2604 synthase